MKSYYGVQPFGKGLLLQHAKTIVFTSLDAAWDYVDADKFNSLQLKPVDLFDHHVQVYSEKGWEVLSQNDFNIKLEKHIEKSMALVFN